MTPLIEPSRKFEILLVEDNAFDRFLIQMALKETTIAYQLTTAVNGDEALEYLTRSTASDRFRRPDLILLDLNLPRKDGREVLAEIKSNPRLRTIPVIVLTTSRADSDVYQSYDGHVNCFITKPIDVEKFTDVVKAVSNFWFSVAVLPPKVG